METFESHIEPHKAQIELERLNRLYAMLSHINRTIVRTEAPQELYTAACRIAIEYGGFVLAWIGLLEPGTAAVIPVASAGAATVAELKRIDDVMSNPEPTVRATRADSPFIVNDAIDDPYATSWRSMIEALGLHAGGSFPIRQEGSIIGAFNVVAEEADFFRDAEISLLVEVADDISFALEVIRQDEKRIAAESKMRYLAYYDSQTGMPSRTLFEERLAEVCRDEATKSVVVLVPNLRRYHSIVQLLGPDAGQEIIRAMAARLESALPTLAFARVTESKFAAILRDPEGLDVAEELAWQMHRLLVEAIQSDGQELFLDPFVGIAQYPKDGEPADVLKHALQAAAAQDSTSPCRFFFADMDECSRRQLNLDAALRRALERNEFMLHYQPQVDLASGQIIGAEVLLRWLSRDFGLVSPQDFIPMLEDNGLIGAVGEWVLQEACRCAKQWQDQGLPPFRMAVNLSARQFLDNDIRAMVRRTLETTQLDPQWLELELTESIVLRNAENVIRTMHDLNADGLSFALDDFGTGYSSLSYLQRLPVTRIKIDRSFVINITSNPSDAAIVRAVVGMAHSLGLTVIAEGVETEGQLGFLRGVGCEEIQGYYFSRPLPGNEFAELLREGRCIPPGHLDRPERVLLLVDDEPNILSSLNRALRRKGFHILSTTSTREGFELLATHRPGVVLCDQRMPEMTGTEFLRRVKDIYPDTVRMVLSGYADLNSVIDSVNKGAVYKFLTKPWEDDALSESIKDAFLIYELHQENRALSLMLKARQTDSDNIQ
jgi:EAL domain-containing protein (putative c-di-GMP-specific phosphodiesterase class I)/GGDEF domain-containing protein/ActR/RegA family two-component response regulator